MFWVRMCLSDTLPSWQQILHWIKVLFSPRRVFTHVTHVLPSWGLQHSRPGEATNMADDCQIMPSAQDGCIREDTSSGGGRLLLGNVKGILPRFLRDMPKLHSPPRCQGQQQGHLEGVSWSIPVLLEYTSSHFLLGYYTHAGKKP